MCASYYFIQSFGLFIAEKTARLTQKLKYAGATGRFVWKSHWRLTLSCLNTELFGTSIFPLIFILFQQKNYGFFIIEVLIGPLPFFPPRMRSHNYLIPDNSCEVLVLLSSLSSTSVIWLFVNCSIKKGEQCHDGVSSLECRHTLRILEKTLVWGLCDATENQKACGFYSYETLAAEFLTKVYSCSSTHAVRFCEIFTWL